MHATSLHYTTPHYTTLHCTTLHYTTLHYTTLHYTTLHYTTLHYTKGIIGQKWKNVLKTGKTVVTTDDDVITTNCYMWGMVFVMSSISPQKLPNLVMLTQRYLKITLFRRYIDKMT